MSRSSYGAVVTYKELLAHQKAEAAARAAAGIVPESDAFASPPAETKEEENNNWNDISLDNKRRSMSPYTEASSYQVGGPSFSRPTPTGAAPPAGRSRGSARSESPYHTPQQPASKGKSTRSPSPFQSIGGTQQSDKQFSPAGSSGGSAGKSSNGKERQQTASRSQESTPYKEVYARSEGNESGKFEADNPLFIDQEDEDDDELVAAAASTIATERRNDGETTALLGNDTAAAPSQGGSRETETSTWVPDFADEFDFCIILPVFKNHSTSAAAATGAGAGAGSSTDKLEAEGKIVVQKLLKLGFDIFVYHGIRGSEEMIVLVRTPLDVIRSFAEEIGFIMPLDPVIARTQIEAGDHEHCIAPTVIAHRPDITQFQPYQLIFSRYSRKSEHLYQRELHKDHPFHDEVRLKLGILILESRLPDGSPRIRINRLIADGSLKACFPLHDRARTEILSHDWNRYPFEKLPLYQIKEYFGEKIALYFAFSEHVTSHLFWPAVLGIPIQITVYVTDNLSSPYLVLFAFYIAIWAVFMLEFWRRREKMIALEWGTIHYEVSEIERPDFQGTMISSYVDGSRMLHFPSRARYRILFQSALGIILLVALVIGVVVSIYLIRFTLTPRLGDYNAQEVASFANSAQIMIANYLYGYISEYLTDRENHRTDTQYEDSMIMKLSWFQFINSYASFFYLAFIAEYVGDCPADTGCMSSLAVNLAVVFGTDLAWGMFAQVVWPWGMFRYKYHYAAQSAADHPHPKSSSNSSSNSGEARGLGQGQGAYSSRNNSRRDLLSSNETSPSKYSTPSHSRAMTPEAEVLLNSNPSSGSGGGGMKKSASGNELVDENFERLVTRPEKEFMLEEYAQPQDTIGDYAEVAVSFGYTALFVSALPIAAACFMLFNIAQIKGDGWKLLNLHRRPFPRGCEDIGTWQTIFMGITVASVVTNAGIAVFTMQNLRDMPIAHQFWVFIIFQWVCFSLQAIIIQVIPDVPEEIEIQLQRTEFIVSKLVDKKPDDHYGMKVDEAVRPVHVKRYPHFGGFYGDNNNNDNNYNNNVSGGGQRRGGSSSNGNSSNSTTAAKSPSSGLNLDPAGTLTRNLY